MKKTALITGASTGIGRELSLLFAKDGIDCILVARDKGKLESVAQELKSLGAGVEIMAMDLSDPESPRRLYTSHKDRIHYLVNNAGFGTNGPFAENDLDQELKMIDLNIRALVELSHYFLADFRAAKSGRILNVASTAGFQPGPYMAVYYASKSFVLHFSEALAEEVAGDGISVTCLCPGATATEFARRAGNEKSLLFNSGMVASAEYVARAGYRAMHRGRRIEITGFLNKVLVQSLRCSPRLLVRKIASRLNR